jgi:hypothetical protein
MCGGGDPNGAVVNLPAKKWTPAFRWKGKTKRIFSFRVDVTGAPPGTLVKWRRYGIGVVPYAAGSFTKRMDFNVYPTDRSVTIDLWCAVNATVKAKRARAKKAA